MRIAIAIVGAALATLGGLALGMQGSLMLHELSGSLHTPLGEAPMSVMTPMLLAGFVGAVSMLAAMASARRMHGFTKGRGSFRVSRDLPPLAGLALAAGMALGPTLVHHHVLKPAADEQAPRHEYDQRLDQLESRVLRAVDAIPGKIPPPTRIVERHVVSDGDPCQVEADRVLARRTEWVKAHLGHDLDCASPAVQILGFDATTAGAVALDERAVCDPAQPFGLNVLSDSYVKCGVTPSDTSKRALEALRAKVALAFVDTVEFVGHTDDDGIRNVGCRTDEGGRVWDNWQLSALRADRARQHFVSADVPIVVPYFPTPIRAVAYGVQHERPLPREDGEEDDSWQERNRRVTVTITSAGTLNLDLTKCLKKPLDTP